MRKCTACNYISLPEVERYSSNQAPMIMLNMYITQLTSSHHGILMLEKITTYLDAKGTSKNYCFLYKQIIHANTPDFTRGRLYDRVNFFPHSTQDCWISQRLLYSAHWKIAYHRSYHKILGKHHVAEVRYKAFESTLADISTRSDYAERFNFEPDSYVKNKLFDNNCTLYMEGCCLGRFRKTVNGSNFYDNGGGYVHQYHDTVRDFHLHLSESNLQNAATTTSHLYTLLDGMFEKNKW